MTFSLSVLKILFIVLTVFAVATYVRATLRAQSFEQRYPPTGTLLDVDGIQVHAQIMGAGPDLVLIHGASGNTRDMALSLGAALASDYRVIIFDRPGLGYTGRTDPSYANYLSNRSETPREQADLLVRAARQLGVENPIVVGHSFGGAVAAAWATYYPDDLRAFVNLAGATYPWNTPVDWLYRWTASPLGRVTMPYLVGAWVPETYVETSAQGIFGPNDGPADYAKAIGAYLVIRPASMKANANQVYNLRDAVRVQSQDYPSIAVPVEILHGDLDTIVGLGVHSDRMARDVQGANLTILEGAGHMIQHTHLDEILAAISRADQASGLNSDR